MKKKTLQVQLLLGTLAASALLLNGCGAATQTEVETNSSAEDMTEAIPSEEASTVVTSETAEDVSSYGQFDGLKYKVVNDEITITSYMGSEDSATIEIPSEIDGKVVVGIGDNSFQESKVAYVTLPDTITSIGNEAFRGCLQLQEIIIPDSVTSIGTDAFRIMTNANGKYNIIKCGEGSFAQEYAADNNLIYLTKTETSENQNILFAQYTWVGEKAKINIYEYQNEAGESVEWRFDICNSETNEVTQTVSMLPDESGDPHMKTMIKEKDVTFDGNNELLISKGHFGNSGVLYDTCFIWDDTAKTYLEDDSYGEIPNPEVIASKNSIRGFIDFSSSEYHYYMYTFQNNSFECVADLTLKGETSGKISVIDTRLEDGQMQVASENTAASFDEALQLFGNDGYWDLSINE